MDIKTWFWMTSSLENLKFENKLKWKMHAVLGNDTRDSEILRPLVKKSLRKYNVILTSGIRRRRRRRRKRSSHKILQTSCFTSQHTDVTRHHWRLKYFPCKSERTSRPLLVSNWGLLILELSTTFGKQTVSFAPRLKRFRTRRTLLSRVLLRHPRPWLRCCWRQSLFVPVTVIARKVVACRVFEPSATLRDLLCSRPFIW